ncbi:RsmE family RNA methyltransferase [Spirochaetia bacterium 38H-sp]|uniref:Ribosomal RNA small subunit methyltransferase E n=1 Tax=Rarispira pelagica TaxID=3141764 RepID=A0ABU9UC59_9SPIR
MNIIILENAEKKIVLPSGDRRARHITDILKADRNTSLRVGVVGGLMGSAFINNITPDCVELSCTFTDEPPPLLPVRLLVAAVRPIVAKRLLRDLTAAGIEKLVFFPAKLTEKSYLSSNIWKNNNYMEYVLHGCEQGIRTNYPDIQLAPSLKKAIELVSGDIRFICDENTRQESVSAQISAGIISLAIGPERGWTEEERDMLLDNGYKNLSLGSGILRTETACHVALGRIIERFSLAG